MCLRDKLEKDNKVIREAIVIKAINGPLDQTNFVTLDTDAVEELDRVKWGCIQAYKKIWDLFGLDAILKQSFKDRKIQFDALNTILLLTVDRLIDPTSKLKTFVNTIFVALTIVNLKFLTGSSALSTGHA